MIGVQAPVHIKLMPYRSVLPGQKEVHLSTDSCIFPSAEAEFLGHVLEDEGSFIHVNLRTDLNN